MIYYLLKCLHFFVFAGVFSLFINTLYLTFPIYMMVIYNRVLASASFSTLYSVSIGAVMALFVLGVLEFLRSRILIKASIKMDDLLGRQVLKKMLRDAPRRETKQYSQGLGDINILRNYFAGNSVFAFFDVPWIPVYLGVIYMVHPVLGHSATGGAAVLLFLGLLQNMLTKDDFEEIHALKVRENNLIQKSRRNAEMLKCMGMLENTARHWNRINDPEMAVQNKTGKKSQVLNSISISFRTFMQVLIYCMGALLVIRNEVNMGAIIAASIIMGRALAPVQQSINAWKQTISARASYKRLDTLLKTSTPEDFVDTSHIEGELEVRDVALEIGDKTIFEGLSFDLKPGESMGLVGHNGAGKTCLCRMLLGMWEPSAGVIRLDGLRVSRLDPEQMGAFVGYLPQAIELFTGTVSENIARMGAVDAEKVIAAATMAGAHDVILRFTHGYETDIGEAGLSLSGGQRQRVGLARALYGDPALVILDEPNSNLDEAGEQALVHALEELKARGKTVILITHKPAILSGVDKILLLNQGGTPRFGHRAEFF